MDQNIIDEPKESSCSEDEIQTEAPSMTIYYNSQENKIQEQKPEEKEILPPEQNQAYNSTDFQSGAQNNIYNTQNNIQGFQNAPQGSIYSAQNNIQGFQNTPQGSIYNAQSNIQAPQINFQNSPQGIVYDPQNNIQGPPINFQTPQGIIYDPQNNIQGPQNNEIVTEYETPDDVNNCRLVLATILLLYSIADIIIQAKGKGICIAIIDDLMIMIIWAITLIFFIKKLTYSLFAVAIAICNIFGLILKIVGYTQQGDNIFPITLSLFRLMLMFVYACLSCKGVRMRGSRVSSSHYSGVHHSNIGSHSNFGGFHHSNIGAHSSFGGFHHSNIGSHSHIGHHGHRSHGHRSGGRH